VAASDTNAHAATLDSAPQHIEMLESAAQQPPPHRSRHKQTDGANLSVEWMRIGVGADLAAEAGATGPAA